MTCDVIYVSVLDGKLGEAGSDFQRTLPEYTRLDTKRSVLGTGILSIPECRDWFKAVPLVEFIYLVFTRMPGERCRRATQVFVCLCYVFQALINSLVC